MAVEPVRPVYKCTQGANYSGCGTVADNLQAKLAEMAAFRGRYTAAFVTAFRGKIADAMALPDDQARGADAQALLVQMNDKRDVIMGLWVDTGRYIEGAFPKGEWAIRREEAGNKHFAKVGTNNWDELVMACSSNKGFLVAKAVTLEDGGLNMPNPFPGEFKTQSDAFDSLYAAFKVAEQTTVATNIKINANNAIFNTAMEICKDGQAKFKDDEGVTKMFTWTVIQELINPPGSASLELVVLDIVTLMPVVDAVIVIQTEGGPQITLSGGATGIAKEVDIDPAVYSGVAKAPGYVELAFVKDVDKGVNAGKKLYMAKV